MPACARAVPRHGTDVGAVVVQFIEYGGPTFSCQDHSYGSILHTLGGFVLTVAVAAIVMGGPSIHRIIRGQYIVRRHVPVTNVALSGPRW